MASKQEAVCNNITTECPVCERSRCIRCGRCKEEVPADSPGVMRLQCPSVWCRLRKVLPGFSR